MLAMKQEGQLDYIDENEEWRKIEEVMASLDANLLSSFSINNNHNKRNNSNNNKMKISSNNNGSINTNNTNNDISINTTNNSNTSSLSMRRRVGINDNNKRGDEKKRLSIECSNAAYNINNNINNNININKKTSFIQQAPEEDTVCSVEEWLASLRLSHLQPTFLSHGFDHLSFMGPDIFTASDLSEMGVSKQHHHTILSSLCQLPTISFNSQDHHHKHRPPTQSTTTHHPTFFVSVVEWLMWLGLPHLIDSFTQHHHTSIHHLLTITPPQLTSEFGVSRLGHINRITASINFLTNNIHNNNHTNNNNNLSNNNNNNNINEGRQGFRVNQNSSVNKSELTQNNSINSNNIYNNNNNNNNNNNETSIKNKNNINTNNNSNNNNSNTNNNINNNSNNNNNNNTETTTGRNSSSLKSVIPEEERMELEELLKECEVFSELLTDNTSNNLISTNNNLYTKSKSEGSNAFNIRTHSTTQQRKTTPQQHTTIYATTPRLRQHSAAKNNNNTSTTSLYSSLHQSSSSSTPLHQPSSQPQSLPQFLSSLIAPSSSSSLPPSSSVTAQSSSSSPLPSSSTPLPSSSSPLPSSSTPLPSSSSPLPSSSTPLPSSSSPLPSSSSSLRRTQKADLNQKGFPALYMGSIKLHSIENQELARKCIQQIRQQQGQGGRQRDSYLTVSNNRVSFLDAASKELLGLHSVASIFCVCQDQVDLEFFSFVTFDLVDHVHFCHVFQANDVDKSTEIVLAMAEAFDQAFAIFRQQQPPQQQTSQQQQLQLPQHSSQKLQQPKQVSQQTQKAQPQKQKDKKQHQNTNSELPKQQQLSKQQQLPKQQQLSKQQHSTASSNPIFEETAILT